MRGLIFDPFAGVSGDMILGALVDLGLPEDWLRGFVDSLGLGAELVVDRVDRSGIDCARVVVRAPASDAHRHLADILDLLETAELAPGVRDRAERVFRRLAEAEAAVHGVSVDRVHFHEVGAVDSVVDVVSAVAGVRELGYGAFYSRPIGVGTGTIAMDHGTYPLPAPATARLLEGLSVRETGYPEECTTPTGAAVVAELTGGVSPPEVVYGRSGFGAGSRDPTGRPNCLRLIECTIPASPSPGGAGSGRAVYALQADMDDLSPEYVAAAREAVMEAGALDVTLVRVDMKKGRPGVRLEALAPEASLAEVLEAFFAGTSTIGVRYWRVDRAVLQRAEELAEWRGHGIRMKRVTLPDGTTRRKPEYDDVAAAARAEGLTAYEVRVELEREEGRNGPGV